jgi:hypothetical protein
MGWMCELWEDGRLGTWMDGGRSKGQFARSAWSSASVEGLPGGGYLGRGFGVEGAVG